MATPSQIRLENTSSGRTLAASQAPPTKANDVSTMRPTVMPADAATVPAPGAPAEESSAESTRWANVSKTSGTGREGRRRMAQSIRFPITRQGCAPSSVPAGGTTRCSHRRRRQRMRRSRIIALSGAVALATTALGVTATSAGAVLTAPSAQRSATEARTYQVLADAGVGVKDLTDALTAAGATVTHTNEA